MKLLLYCTKAKPYLYDQFGIRRSYDNKYSIQKIKQTGLDCLLRNGKIVAECDFEVEEIFEDNLEDARDGYVEHFYTLKSYDDFDEGQKILLKESCLQKHELSNYLGFDNGYAIHIKNLHIFDKPKELENYYHFVKYYINELKQPITKAPQNMMYVELDDIKYVLISIQTQWLCKILNGEKTIEVRKKVLKEMLE